MLRAFFITIFSLFLLETPLIGGQYKITHICIDPAVLFQLNEEELYKTSLWNTAAAAINSLTLSQPPTKQQILEQLQKGNSSVAETKFPIFRNGQALPFLVSDAFTGKRAENNTNRLFLTKSSQLKNTVYHTAALNFIKTLCDPDKFAKVYTPRPHAIQLLRSIKEQHPEKKVVLCGNFPDLQTLKKHFSKLFSLFDRTYISGRTKTVKSFPHFYITNSTKKREKNKSRFPSKTTLCLEVEEKHCHRNIYQHSKIVNPDKPQTIFAALAQYGIQVKPKLLGSSLKESHFSIPSKNNAKAGEDNEWVYVPDIQKEPAGWIDVGKTYEKEPEIDDDDL